MKKYIFLLLALPFHRGLSQSLSVSTCNTVAELNNPGYSKAVDLQEAMEQLVSRGIPGCVMAVYSHEGWWTSSAGLAKIEDQTVMQPCHLQYLQSISKTYLAAAVLKLVEQGKVYLEDPITHYLPKRISSQITQVEKISVRMIMNHTSGIPEYNQVPAYVSYLLQHPDHFFQPEDYLHYIRNKPLDFIPGSKYSYRNTNYLILSLIADQVTGDHAQFIRETIFKPLGLTQTFYRGSDGYLTYSNLVNTYWDRFSDGYIENVSSLQRTNVASLAGDDGIVTTPVEAVKFLKGLIEGKIISAATLGLMKQWVSDKKGNPTYGLGLDHATFVGYTGYGHSGGGLGAGCQLYYFPDKDVYIFVAINLGTVTESPLHKVSSKTIDSIYSILLK